MTFFVKALSTHPPTFGLGSVIFLSGTPCSRVYITRALGGASSRRGKGLLVIIDPPLECCESVWLCSVRVVEETLIFTEEK